MVERLGTVIIFKAYITIFADYAKLFKLSKPQYHLPNMRPKKTAKGLF
jgi:hypothetical protein